MEPEALREAALHVARRDQQRIYVVRHAETGFLLLVRAADHKRLIMPHVILAVAFPDGQWQKR